MEQDKTVFLAVRIPEILKHKIKVKAVEKKVSIQFYIKDLLEKGIEEIRYEKI